METVETPNRNGLRPQPLSPVVERASRFVRQSTPFPTDPIPPSQIPLSPILPNTCAIPVFDYHSFVLFWHPASLPTLSLLSLSISSLSPSLSISFLSYLALILHPSLSPVSLLRFFPLLFLFYFFFFFFFSKLLSFFRLSIPFFSTSTPHASLITQTVHNSPNTCILTFYSLITNRIYILESIFLFFWWTAKQLFFRQSVFIYFLLGTSRNACSTIPNALHLHRKITSFYDAHRPYALYLNYFIKNNGRVLYKNPICSIMVQQQANNTFFKHQAVIIQLQQCTCQTSIQYLWTAKQQFVSPDSVALFCHYRYIIVVCSHFVLPVAHTTHTAFFSSSCPFSSHFTWDTSHTRHFLTCTRTIHV